MTHKKLYKQLDEIVLIQNGKLYNILGEFVRPLIIDHLMHCTYNCPIIIELASHNVEEFN